MQRKNKVEAKDILLAIGFLSVGIGFYFVYMPLSFIVCGALLLHAFYPREKLPKVKETKQTVEK